jgi:hypothetical protein
VELEEGQMIKRLLLLVLAATVICLLIASVAIASTPADIVKDFEEHGELTGTYSHQELQDFLNDPYYNAYPPKHDQALRTLVTTMLNENRSTFPFTGFQLMIAGIVAVALVGGGLLLRRFARSS